MPRPLTPLSPGRETATIEELEPRILLSADLPFISTASDALALHAHVQVLETPSALIEIHEAAVAPVYRTQEIAFVDAGVQDYELLVNDIQSQSGGDRHIEVFVLDATRSGIEQISEILAHRDDIAAMHVISHGAAGQLQLGDDVLDFDTLSTQAGRIKAWGQALTADADLLIYGCDVAATAQGRSMLTALSALTGADVEASTDVTGNAAQAADWNLEYHTGTIESNVALSQTLQQSWTGVLSLTTQGGETLVNTGATAGDQRTTPYGGGNLAMDASGNFVVVYTDANSLDIYAQRYDASGVTQGSAFRVNTTTGNDHSLPVVAMNASGNFVVAWASQNQDAAGTYGVYAQRYNAAGVAQGSEFLVNSTTSGDQNAPAIAMADDGSFAISYTDYDVASGDIVVRRYDASGNNTGTATWGTANVEQHSAIAMNGSGAYVVTWDADNVDSAGTWGIYGRRFNASGTQLGSEFRINTTVTGNQTHAAGGMASDGSFVVAWESLTQDSGSNAGIYAQRFNVNGEALGTEFRVNTTTTGDQNTPAIAVRSDGHFIVSWVSTGQDNGATQGIYAQQYNASGIAKGGETLVNTTTASDQTDPSVVLRGANAVIAWSGNGPGDTIGVFMQRYSAAVANTYTVTNTNDSGAGSLRQAIQNANANATDAIDIIDFNITGAGPHIITPTTTLDTITDAVLIDGTTQSGWVAGSYLPIVIDGNNLSGDGLTFSATSDGSTLRGMVIRDFVNQGINFISGGDGHQVYGNFIGALDSNGNFLTGEGNGGTGIDIYSANNIIGGTTAALRNVFGGNGYSAMVLVTSASTGNIIQGNYIGVGPDGTTAIGNARGIYAWNGSNNNLIGGTQAGQGNIIANNTFDGVSMVVLGATVHSTAVLGNSIYAAGSLGIDLDANGVATNDAGDADGGQNNLQNYPVLATARTDGASQLILTGTFNSTASSYYRIEFFANTAQNSTGYGEGRTYLGYVNVATDASGNATIGTTFSTNVTVGTFISATVTRSNSTYTTFTDTSEFARNIAAVSSTQATVTVTTASDTNDGDITSLSRLIANPGADGLISLREAINAANNTANGSGADRIHFGIAGTGTHTINPATALPWITEAVVIDATTDDSFAANGNKPAIVLDGNDLAAYGLVLTGTAGGSTIRGLVVRDFGWTGIVIQSGANGNKIAGNYLGRLDTSGEDAGAGEGNTLGGLAINSGSSNNVIGGTSTADRNVLSGNGTDGISLQGSSNTILGNYFGINAAGSLVIGNHNQGIWLSDGSNNLIGDGTTAGANVLGGSTLYTGITVTGSSTSNNLIRGNFIGTDATGTLNFGNAAQGIWLESSTTGTAVGGVNAGDGNVIAFNGSGGIVTKNGSTASGHFLGNRLYSNGGLGIDNNNDGVTANDAGDVDTGPNGKQNFPVVVSANSTGGNTTITGTLSTEASKTYRIEFFSSATGDTSTYGEGQVYLGSVNVTTDSGGVASFAHVLTSITVTAGHLVSATATEDLGGGNFGGTSEFASNIAATNTAPGVSVSAISGNTTEAGGTATFTVVLNTAPIADVTIAISTGDATEGSISVSTLTFTSTNWSTPQTVTVTGVNDALDDGDIGFSIITGTTSSTDPLYNNLTVADVSVTNTDDDAVPVLDLDANNSSGATGVDFVTTHAEGIAGGVLIADADASLTDDDTNLASMTVSITNLLDGTAESLSADTSGTSIGVSYNSGSGVLTLTGTDTVANYQKVLRTLRYANSSDAPSTTARIITVVANDGALVSNTARATVSVTSVNDEQVLTTNTGVTLAENSTGTMITSAMLATTDVDHSAGQLTYILSAVPANGTLKLSGVALGVSSAFTQSDINGGLLTYDHAGTETSSDSFAFSVNDGTGTTSSGTFNITITPVNDNAPSITSSATASVVEGTTAVIALTSTDTDVPAGTPSYSIVGGADQGLFSINASTGAITFSSAPNFEAPTDAGANNVYNLTVRVSDGVNTSTQAIAVTVTNANEAPSGSTGTVTTNEDAPYTFSAADFGFTDPDAGDTLSAVRIDSLPAAGSLTLAGVALNTGDVVLLASLIAGDLVFTPVADANGVAYASFSFSVRDTNGPAFDIAPNTMSVNVTAVNDPPVANAESYSLTLDSVLSVTAPGVSANDTDVDANPLAAALVSGAGNGAVLLNADGSFSYTPTPGFVGIDSFTYRVNDGTVNSNTATVTLTVMAKPTTGGGVEPIIIDPQPDLAPEPKHDLAPESGTERPDASSDPHADTAVSAAASTLEAYLARAPQDAPMLEQSILGSNLPSHDRAIAGRAYTPASRALNPTHTAAQDELVLEFQWQLVIRRGLDIAQSSAGTASTDLQLPTDRPQQDESLTMASILAPGLWGGLVAGFGTAWWAGRAGILMASVVAGTPAWARLDPLPIATRSDDEDPNVDLDEEDEDREDEVENRWRRPKIDQIRG